MARWVSVRTQIDGLYDADNRHDANGTLEFLADGYHTYVNGAQVTFSKEDERLAAEGLYGALPDVNRELQWVGVNESRALVQWVSRGTHAGQLSGHPGTGRRIELHGCTVFEHADGLLQLGRMFMDSGEMERQLKGLVRTPSTVTAAALAGSADPWALPERKLRALEAAGKRLVERVYEAENSRDADAYVGCFTSPWLHHIFGRSIPMAPTSDYLLGLWINRDISYEIEEIVSVGDRAAARFHVRGVRVDGAPISQHGCKVYEHDGQVIMRDWAYWPVLDEINPGIYEADLP